MAYTSGNLTAIHGGNGYTHWHYTSTDDTLAVIGAYGYFTAESGNMVRTNDTMMVVGSDAIACFRCTAGGEGTTVTIDQMRETRTVREEKKVYLSVLMEQTQLLAGTSYFVGTQVAGYVTRFTTVVKKAVTTGGTLTIELAGTAVPGLSITVADAATVGTVQSAIPDNPYLAANLVPAITAGGTGDIEFVGDSNFATAGEVFAMIEITPFPALHSTNNLAIGTWINSTDLLAGTSHFVISPIDGQIETLNAITNVAVGTGGALTVELGGTAVTGLSCAVASSAAAGDNDTDDAADLSGVTGAVTAGQAIELVGDATFASSGDLWESVEINPTTDADVLAYATDFIGQTDLLAGTSHFVIAPVSGYIVRARSVVKKAVTTGGTLTIELGGDAVDGLSMVVADSSSVGDVDTGTPNGTNTKDTRVSKGDAIEIVGDTAFASAGEVWVIVEIQPV